MATLYELSAAYRALSERLNDADADMPPEVIADTLDGEAGDLEEKVTNTAKVIQNMRAEAKAIREAMADMSARAAATDKRADSLESYLLANMQLADMPKVKSPWFIVSLKTSQRTIIDDESLIPADYLREIPAVADSTAPDKALIKKSLADGYAIPGAHVEQHVTVSIK